MVIQRMLKAAMHKEESPYTVEELEDIVAHCTDNEGLYTYASQGRDGFSRHDIVVEADKVERQVMKSAIAQVYGPRLGETFQAMVIGASDQGTWIRLASPEPPGSAFSFPPPSALSYPLYYGSFFLLLQWKGSW